MIDEDDDERDLSDPRDQDVEVRWGCLFPGACCMPGPHMVDECHTAEMLMQQHAESEAATWQEEELIPCPACHGLPTHPEIEGCHGCDKCDYHGTLARFKWMKQAEHEANLAADEIFKLAREEEEIPF